MTVHSDLNGASTRSINDHTEFATDGCRDILLWVARQALTTAVSMGATSRFPSDAADGFFEGACWCIWASRYEVDWVADYLSEVAGQTEDGTLTAREIWRLDLLANYREADPTDAAAAKVDAERIANRMTSEW